MYDKTMLKNEALQKRKPDDPSPWIVGRDTVQRYLTVAEECGKADLITARDTELTRLPWVGHRSRRWEPEPLRWAGVNAGLWTMQLADRSEARKGRPSRMGRALGRLLGE